MVYKFDNIEHPYFKERLETELKDRYQQYLKYALDKISQDESIGKCKDGRINKCCHNTKERFIKVLKERNKGLTLGEIGKTLNLSGGRIRQIEIKALKKISLPSFYKPILDELLLGEYKKIEDNLLSNKYGDGIGLVYRQLKRELDSAIKSLNTLEYRVGKLVENQIQSTENQTEEFIKKEKLLENLSEPIELLDISVRSASCMEFYNIKYVGDLVQKTEAELLEKKNFGRKSLSEIKYLLSEMGLYLGINVIEEYTINGKIATEDLKDILSRDIKILELEPDIIDALNWKLGWGRKKIENLVQEKEEELSKYQYGFGKEKKEMIHNIERIKNALSKHGLKLGMKVHRFKLIK